MSEAQKNVIITGAAGNLGKAAVTKFAAEGYRVIATVEPGRALGYDVPETVSVYPVDLQDETSAADFVAKITTTFTSIDAALLLVGGFGGGNISAVSGKDIRKLIALNFETAFFVARPAFGQMLKQENGGRIVLVGARAALEPDMGKNFIAYSLSKSLLFDFAELLNAEGASRKVVTSVIVPSTIDTPANRSQMPKADFSKWVLPEKIAEVLAFIASDKASAVSGTVLKVYGTA
jgi:NAD(P)-dependent dehydrogenase (short-subunit alcohol dehydrogenase family)